MSISSFAKTVDLPLCAYFNSIPFDQANKEKEPLHFLKGDPTQYGNQQLKMQETGYEALRNVLASPANHGYTMTNGVPPAREAIVNLYKPKFEVTANHVVIQHGANQSLFCALLSFTNPGDDILVPEFGYPIFQKLAPALNVNLIKYKLTANFQIDLEHVKAVMTPQTQFIFIINPMNPTGKIFSLEHMQQILNFCDENQLPIVADEVYHGQSFPGHTFHSFGDVTEEVPVIVINGVEKMLSVPGWSTSWSIIFDKNQYLQVVWRNIGTCGMIFLHSNKPTQIVLPQLFKKELHIKTDALAKVQQNQKYLRQKLSGFDCFCPIQANGTIYQTVMINTQKFKDIGNDRQFADKLLIEQNVAVLPVSVMGSPKPGFRLITCGNQQLYAKLLGRIQNFYQNHKA